MKLEITIEFCPQDYVTVKLFGLDYHGRVLEVRYDGNFLYKVQYAEEGTLKTGEFFYDELEAKT